MTEAGELETAVAAHDAALVALGLDIWVGNEPTFTDRYSHADEWTAAALGPDKLQRAERVVAQWAAEQHGCAVLRSIGRQYPGEPAPRWSFGLYSRRDGEAVWSGPRDPLLAREGAPADLDVFQAQLDAAFANVGFARRAFRGPSDRRILVAPHSATPIPDPSRDRRPSRPSIHSAPAAERILHDDLAIDGFYLLIVSSREDSGRVVPCVELPAVDDVGLFLRLMDVISRAAEASGLPSLILSGFSPPVDASVRWTTVTPDPAVVEINMAPHGSVLAFLRDNRRCYATAAATGLEPYRLHFNGAVADSGGGGQITFGGPSPRRSPFFLEPRLLPRLIRYALRHPALSYLFAHDYIGASGQSVRPDEHCADAHSELKLALALLDHHVPRDPATIWLSLAPSLTDPVGNSHRAELNIEKLWNPYLPGRGQLGLVEFRAFRMQHTPERAAALAALLRAILAMLTTGAYRAEPTDWGSDLHDRFALPFYLEADLCEVLGDLETANLGLAHALRAELEIDRCRPWSEIEFDGCVLTIRRALEFWSLLGDASNQQGTSRLVDASSSRVELALRPAKDEGAETLEAWQLRAEGIDLPMRAESDAGRPARVFGVRYRSFAPKVGMHPLLGPQVPVRLLLVNRSKEEALEVALHEWRADGQAYDGLPADLEAAAERRAARCVRRRIALNQVPEARPAPRGSLSEYSLDLRYASASSSGFVK
ncbi:MAG: transglutaminase family protein [Polyangiaceae bacterium]